MAAPPNTGPLHPFVAALVQRIDQLESVERQALGDLLRLDGQGYLTDLNAQDVESLYQIRLDNYRRQMDPARQRQLSAYRLALFLAGYQAYHQVLAVDLAAATRAELYWSAVEIIVQGLQASRLFNQIGGADSELHGGAPMPDKAND